MDYSYHMEFVHIWLSHHLKTFWSALASALNSALAVAKEASIITRTQYNLHNIQYNLRNIQYNLRNIQYNLRNLSPTIELPLPRILGSWNLAYRLIWT